MQPKASRRLHAMYAIPLALSLLFACKAPPVAPTAADEGTVRLADRHASLSLGGKAFAIARKDGGPLGELGLAIDGTVYPLQNGSFKVPKATLDDALASGKRIALIGRSFLPRLIDPGQAGGELALV